MMKRITLIPYLKKVQKYINPVTQFSWYQYFFTGNHQILVYQEIYNFYFFLTFFEPLNMVKILMMSAKIATLDLFKIKLFWNSIYGIIISAHDVTNKILLGDSNYVVDVVMCLNFGNCSTSMREVIITSFL